MLYEMWRGNVRVTLAENLAPVRVERVVRVVRSMLYNSVLFTVMIMICNKIKQQL